jgi:hypothetical protein
VNAKTNANLNANRPVISAAIIRVAPLFAGDVLLFLVWPGRAEKSSRLVQGRITAIWQRTLTQAAQEGLRNRARAFQPRQSD